MNNNNSDPNKKRNLKTPVPTPRAVPQNESTEYEYLRFSLRITEDIIRNNLYNPKDLERVFNSHIEANRDRLDMVSISLISFFFVCKFLKMFIVLPFSL